MQTVILPVGQRGSGKSTFCEKAVWLDPSIGLVSRDQILIKIFGKTSLNPYTGEQGYAQKRLWQCVEKELGKHSHGTLILDTWTGYSGERTHIIGKLRELGVARIEAWYFVTPVEWVEKWFWAKPGIAKIQEMGSRNNSGLSFYGSDAPRNDYKVFHQNCENIDSNGFDEVLRINPLNVRPEHVLKLQKNFEL